MTLFSEPSSFSEAEIRLAPHTVNRRPHLVPDLPSRILLVDDDADLRAVMEALLTSAGYRVHAASDARQAILRFSISSPFDLLLSDVQMPGLSGLELAQVLTVLQRPLPVLLTSGSSLPLASRQTLTVRGWSFLPKPFAVPQLLTEIEALLARRRRG